MDGLQALNGPRSPRAAARSRDGGDARPVRYRPSFTSWADLVSEATTAAVPIVWANAAVGAPEHGRQGTINPRPAAGFGAACVRGLLLGNCLRSLVPGAAVPFLLVPVPVLLLDLRFAR